MYYYYYCYYLVEAETRCLLCSGLGDNGSEWMKHWVKGGHNYYYNTQTGEGTWLEPEDFLQNNTQLNKDEIQVRLSSPRMPPNASLSPSFQRLL